MKQTMCSYDERMGNFLSQRCTFQRALEHILPLKFGLKLQTRCAVYYENMQSGNILIFLNVEFS